MINRMILPVLLIVIGVVFFYLTLKDEKNIEKGWTVGYLMHFKGYLGGLGAFLLGVILLMNKLG